MSHNEIAPQNIDQVHGNTSSHTPQPSNAFLEAYKLGADTLAHPDARLRQAEVAIYGAVVGGIKDIPNELINHPWETAGKAALAGVTGAAFCAALAAESPVIAGGAIGVGIVGSGAALWSTGTRLGSNEKLMQSMDAVYKSTDPRTVSHSMQTASDVIGPEAFDYGIAMVGGTAGMFGPKANSSPHLDFLKQQLRPVVKAVQSGAIEIVANGMGKFTPTRIETSLVNDLMQQSQVIIPGVKVRFVCRVEEAPGTQGLLYGVELPSTVRRNGSQVFQLHDFCINLGKQHNMPIGLSISEHPPLWQKLLDLKFLPEDVISKSKYSSANKALLQKVLQTKDQDLEKN